MDALRTTWSQDLGVTLADDQWEQILDRVHSSSICARHSLIQCKILHRAHLTNARLARIYPDRTHKCNRCNQSPADYMHMFLLCPKLSAFWSAVFGTISTVLDKPAHLDPLSALFGFSPTLITSKNAKQVIAYTILLARRLILLKWTHSTPPTHNKWIVEVLKCVRLERVRGAAKSGILF